MLNGYNQRASYWKRVEDFSENVIVDKYGEETFMEPIVVSVRFEFASSLIRNTFGEEIASIAKVMMDFDVNVGDYMSDIISDAIDPRNESKAYSIKRFEKAYSYDNSWSQVVAWL